MTRPVVSLACTPRRWVAPELRAAYRLLKNAGYVPEELRLLSELRTVEQLLVQTVDREERAAVSARLLLLLSRVGASRGMSLQSQAHYFECLVERLRDRDSDAHPDSP